MTQALAATVSTAPGRRDRFERVFRRDINGLRAWAVGAVVLFHFGIPGFDGGFAGVDIFFVISGFLMTQIVCKSLDLGTFSLLGFYLARAVRIIPALVVLCAALLLAGWFALPPPDYKTLGSHTVYSLSFLSNIKYWREVGYFDTSSLEKWLLHTWSLSVEWQFYLVLPVILVGIARLTKNAIWIRRAMVAFGAVSLGLCIWTTAHHPSAAFFLLHTRAWEMLAGGLVFLSSYPSAALHGKRKMLEAAGLALIVLSVVAFNAESAWPGWHAVVPVAGAALVLLAARESLWTGNRIAQWLGDRSYSIYLWHWPVHVVLVYAGWEHSAVAIIAGLLASVAFGTLSFNWVEKPSRKVLHARHFDRRTFVLGAAIATVLLCASGVWFLKGVSGRIDPNVELAAAAVDDLNPDLARCHRNSGVGSPACIFGGKAHKIFVVGDSHVSPIIPSIVAAKPEGDAGVVQLSYAGCVFVPAMRQLRPDRFGPQNDCKGFNDWAAKRLAAEPTVPVLLVGRYARSAFGLFESDPNSATPEVYFDDHRYSTTTPEFLREFGQHLTETACTLAETRTVYMMRPIPEMPVSVPQYVSRRMAWGVDSQLSVTMAQYMQRNAWVWQAQNEARDRCGIVILDPTAQLCHDGVCTATHNGRPLYSDYGHLNQYASKLLVPAFMPIYQSPGQHTKNN